MQIISRTQTVNKLQALFWSLFVDFSMTLKTPQCIARSFLSKKFSKVPLASLFFIFHVPNMHKRFMSEYGRILLQVQPQIDP